MNISLTIGTTPELQRLLEGILSAFTSAKPATVVAEAPAAPAPVKQIKKAAPKAAEAPAPEPAAETTAPGETTVTEASEAVTVSTTVTIEEVRAAAYEKQQAGKKDQLKALLVKFSAAKVTELKPEQYADFLTEVKAIA